MGKNKREPSVIVVHKYHYADEKEGHGVNWWDKKGKLGSKKFKRLSEAKKFAANKARSLGLKSYTDDASKVDPFKVRVTKKPKKRKTRKKPKSILDLF